MTIARLVNEIGFSVKEEDVRKVNETVKNLKNTAQNILGAIGVGIGLSQINTLVEEFTLVKEQVRNSTAELGEQAEIQQKILDAATATRSTYADTAKTVSNLVHENKELFGTIDEAISFNNAATMLFKSAGKTNEEIAVLMEAINKSFAKGYIDSETLSQLLEKSPEAVELLNKQLGTSSNQLEKLAQSGKFAVEDLKNAFLNNSTAIAERFGHVRTNISDALTAIRNRWGLWLADTNEMLGITHSIGSVMVKAFNRGMDVLERARNGIVNFADELGGVETLLKLIGFSAGAIFTAINFDKIKSGISGVIGLFQHVNPQLIALSALFFAVILVIEELVFFLQGKRTVIGDTFDGLGIGAENARQAVFDVFNELKGHLIGALSGIKTFFGKHGTEIKAMFSAVWGAISKILSVAFDLIQTTAKKVFSSLRSFWAKWGSEIKATLSVVGAFLERTFLRITEVITQFANFLGAIFDGDIRGAVESLLAIFQTIFQQIADSISTALDAAWAIVGEKVIAIKDTLIEGLQAGIDWITSLPAQARQWGADIIQGIVDGIKGALGKLGEIASNVVSQVGEFFNIPESEGEDVNSGTAKQTQNVIGRARSNTNRMMDLIVNDIPRLASSATVSPATSSTLVNNSTSKNIVMNNTFNQRFEGEKAAQKKAATAMEQAATDITSEFARALSIS